jgi:hypothetical protein
VRGGESGKTSRGGHDGADREPNRGGQWEKRGGMREGWAEGTEQGESKGEAQEGHGREGS